jgi:hypothetical protein
MPSILVTILSRRASAEAVEIPAFEAVEFHRAAGDLGAHTLDFGSDLVKLHRGLVRLKPFQTAGARRRPYFSRSRRRFIA